MELLSSDIIPRPLASHALAVVLLIIGLALLVIGIAHHRLRQSLFLASPPGSIASAVSLTSHSGFGMFLVPYDTETDIAAKMSTLTFALDERTGAIVAHDRPGVSYSYADDSVEKTMSPGPLDNEKEGSFGSKNDNHPLSTSGYLVEPFSPPAGERSQGL